ncbi:MAG: LysR family transcriptional regulator [Dinoroseobacter sp.]|nr:LysR family transcriptional regulator [Dinoroseobacter sp.]
MNDSLPKIPRTLDLNLLRVFDTLMRERSVSGAAIRLNLTQPSTSNALERLRHALGDRLLVRQGNTMVPTQAAQDFWPHVQAALAKIETGLETLQHFDPSTAEGKLTIGIDAYSMAIMGPLFTANLKSQAPGLAIEYHASSPHLASESLLNGQFDVVIGPVWKPLPGLEHKTLKNETFTCLLSRKLQVTSVDGTISLDSYSSLPHLLYSEVGIVEGNVDVGLESIGRSRTVGVSTPFESTVPEILNSEEMIMTIGRSLGEKLAKQFKLRLLEPPVPVPGFEIGLVWSPVNSSSKRHSWLRDAIEASL